MFTAWKITILLVGYSCCDIVTGIERCSCVDYNACISRNGTVSVNSTKERQQCNGEEVMCCRTLSEEASITVSKNLQDVLQEPRVAPGGGCGRKRFLAETGIMEGGTASSNSIFYGEAPWTVKLLSENLTFTCSGSLISPKVVLTAAHCLGRKRNKTVLFVKAGEYSPDVKNKPLSSQLRSVHKLVGHVGFDEEKVFDDIALLILEQPMELNAIVDVICTPEEGQEVIDSECILSGFGSNLINGTYLGVLKKINYAYESQEYCIKTMKRKGVLNFLSGSNICGVSKEEYGARPGDGGGPLICPLKADPSKMVQIGITSWQFRTKDKFPTTFTSVKNYLPWIREQLKESL